MADWLTDLVNQHEELESPKNFWKWAFMCAISAVVKDNIWINRGGVFNTYPNVFCMLHAESGLKKGPPVNAAKKLVNKVGNTRVISGRGSIQGMLKKIAEGKSAPGGKVISGSTAFICSSELTSSIVEDKAAIKILTDLFDRSYNEGNWESLLKQETESFVLKSPTVTMLSATNEAMSEDFLNRAAIQGGFIGRTFIIYEKNTHAVNSLIFPLKSTPNYDIAANYLIQLSKLQGAFAPLAVNEETDVYNHHVEKFGRSIWFSESGYIYDQWYEEFCKQRKASDVKDETGTLNRFGDAVLKVAMLLSLSKKPALVISPMAMYEAIEECEKLLGNARKTTMGKNGMSNVATFKHMIIMELLTRETHQISHDMLLKKTMFHYNSLDEFNDMMMSFDMAGLIKISSVGNKILYTMPEDQVLELQNYFKGRGR
jgi:hypothetical protein